MVIDPALSSMRGVTIGLLFCLCSPVLASTNSELLRSRALVALEDGQLASALELLVDAVHDDNEDYISHYYLGHVYSRMGDYEGAIAALERARAGGFSSDRLGFELAYAYYQNGEVGKAETLLEQRIAERPDDRNSHFLLGMARYRKALYGPVITPTTPRLSSHRPEAQAAVDYARRYTPDKKTLERLAGLQKLLDELEGPQRDWSLSLSVGGSYDSNVGFFPDDGLLPPEIGDESDSRSVVALEGSWTPYKRDNQSLSASYRFFQSNHQDIEEFDARNHTVGLDYRASYQNLVYGANYQYLDYSLGGDSYRTTHALAPMLMVDHGRRRNSYAKLTLRQHDYKLADDNGRDGNDVELLYRLYLMEASRDEYTYLGATAGRLDSDDESFSNLSYGVNAGGQRRWLDRLWKARIDYRLRDYDKGATPRDEGFLNASLSVEQAFSRRLSGSLSLTGMRNDSTDSNYDFSRTLVDLMLRWGL